MKRARHLLSNLNLINLMLLGAIIFFIMHMLPFYKADVQYSLPPIDKYNIPASGADKKTELAKTSSPIDYAMIAEQNLFHPDRKIPVKAKEAQSLPKADFVLYGTLISDNMNIAYIEDKNSPYNTPGRGKRQRKLSKGQSISGYTLAQVYSDKVVMLRGDEKIEVMVTKGKSRNKVNTVNSPAKGAPETWKQDGGKQETSNSFGRGG